MSEAPPEAVTPEMPQRPAPTRRAAVPPTLVLATLGFAELLVFVIGLLLGARGWDTIILLLALLTALFAAGPIIYDSMRPPERRQILISIISLVYVVSLVVPIFTLYFLLKGEYRGIFGLSDKNPADIAHAQFVTILGLIGLLVGFYSPLGRMVGRAFPKPTRDWTPQATIGVAVAVLGLGWLIYLPSQLGLVPRSLGSGALGTLSKGVFFGIALLALAWRRDRNRMALLMLLVVVPFTMGVNFFSGSKRLFLTAPFMVGLAYAVYERKIRKNWLLAGFLLLVVIYPVNIFYREILGASGGGIRAVFEDPRGIFEALSRFESSGNTEDYLRGGLESTGKRLNALSVLQVIVRDTPERVPYQGGWSIGLILVSYVPRALWPGKPETTIGIWVSQNYGSPLDAKTHIGPSWMGELFLNWGYLGVGLGMCVMGMFFRALQDRLFFWNAPIAALYGATIVLFVSGVTVQGTLISPINGTVYSLTYVLLLHLGVGIVGGYRRSAPASRAGSPS